MICRDLITALALCNNVTPIYEDKIKTFQASSPDEIALVEYACKVGLELFHRTPNQIMLKYQNSEFEFRTLVIVQRLMSIQEYESFNEKLEFAKSSMENREEKMKEVVASIEKEMEYLVATGVEDKLQAKVDKTFQRIMGAGIKI